MRKEVNKEQIYLSIIIPVYNLEKYIGKTIESLLNINFSKNYEIIIINDGSTDDSERIIMNYVRKNIAIRLITIDNSGVSNARNVGIHETEGKYITFVDGDDTVEPDFFEIAVQEMESGDFDFIQGNFRIIDENDKESYSQFIADTEEYANRDNMLRLFLGRPKKIRNSVWGKVFRREVLEKIEFDRKLIMAEDQKFIFDVISKSNRIMLLPVIGYNYYQRNDSAMHTFSIKKEYDKLIVLDYMKSNVQSKDIMRILDFSEIYLLVNLYYALVKGNNSTKKCVARIKSLDLSSIKESINKRLRLKLFLIRHFNYVYWIILRIYWIILMGKRLT